MKPRSAKNKGVRLQNEVTEYLYKIYSQLEPGDIKPAMMSESGVDIKLSPAAKKVIPFAIECKNVEKFNRNSAIKQSELNSSEGRISLVVFKKNYSKTYAIISLEDLINLMK